MDRRRFVGTVAGAFLAAPRAADAWQAAKPARVGWLGNTSIHPHPLAEGLRALGWVEGRNLLIEWRYTEGNIERAPALAADLVRLNLDVIVAASPPVVRAVPRATSSIPIVMVAVSDPVGMGFVTSLGRPGGNITGLSSAIPGGFMSKLLQLTKEAIPNASRVALLYNEGNPVNYATASSSELAEASRALNIQFANHLIESLSWRHAHSG